MIQANELRIGNWVHWYETCKVTAIDTNGGNYISIVTNRGEHRIEIDIERFKPIPLTPEILEKAGFVIDYSWQIPKVQKDNFVMYIDNSDGFTLSANFGHIQQLDVEIKYLHQLQNLYYCLTGKELEIKL